MSAGDTAFGNSLFFGSATRGEMRPDSDIDMLVEFLPDAMGTPQRR
jgi:predicted nucleotidyltransferase